MILFSTMRKLQAKGAAVYVVSVPACTIKKGTLSNMARDGFDNPAQDMTLPAFRDVFASPINAAHRAAQHDQFARTYGLPLSEVDVIPAAKLDAITLQPLSTYTPVERARIAANLARLLRCSEVEARAALEVHAWDAEAAAATIRAKA